MSKYILIFLIFIPNLIFSNTEINFYLLSDNDKGLELPSLFDEGTILVQNEPVLTVKKENILNIEFEIRDNDYDILFFVDDQTAQILKEVTEENVGKKVAMVINDTIYNCPLINAPLTQGKFLLISDNYVFLNKIQSEFNFSNIQKQYTENIKQTNEFPYYFYLITMITFVLAISFYIFNPFKLKKKKLKKSL